MTAPRVSILVISHNTREMTLACLDSVADQTDPGTYELIVVDNASADGSAEAIAARGPQCELIRLERNIGFGPANNLAATRARGEFLLLLNPDTLILERAVERLLAFAARRPAAGIWGGQTRFADGSLNPSSCWAHMSLWSLFCAASGLTPLFRDAALFNPEAYGGWPRDAEREVGIVSGCFLLIRRGLWRDLGGFDPAFFMYAEEADLCLRAARRGARPAITPASRIVHYGGGSEPARADKTVRLLSGKATLLRKHWPPWRRRVALSLLETMTLSRWLGHALAGRLRRQAGPAARAAEWRAVWRRRKEWRRGYATP